MKRKPTLYLICLLLPLTLLSPVNQAYASTRQATDTLSSKNALPANPTDISPLLIGESIPAVVIPDAGGNSYDLKF